MRRIVVAAALVFAIAGVASGQFSEIPAMTVPFSTIDFNLLPAGGTTVGQINAIGNPPGNIVAIDLPYKGTSVLGTYDTNAHLGNALGRLVGGGLGIIAPFGQFDPFTADITLGMMSTEFGFSFGDWNGPAVVGFYDGANFLGSFTTSSISGAAPNKYVRSTIPFNRVTLDTSTTGGNFVIPDLYVQIPEPASLALLGLGALALVRRR